MLSFMDDLHTMLSAADPKGVFDTTSFEQGIEIVVRWAKSEIMRDVRIGVVPTSVPDFSALHDYVNANMYGDTGYWPNMPSETDDEQYQNDFCRFWNAVQDRVDAWIKAGGIRTWQTTSQASS